MSEVFAYMTFRECGCACQATTPVGLPDMLKDKFFKAEWAAGRVRSVMDRDEWNAIPWRCPTCEPILKKQSERYEKKQRKFA